MNSDGTTVVCGGRWLRIARIFDEPWLEPTELADPESILTVLRKSALHADLFTFGATQPDTRPPLPYHREMESLAVVTTKDFQGWWVRLPHATRTNVRRAERCGVITRTLCCDDSFIRGVQAIYDETPVRQGKLFRHYGRDIASVAAGLASYPERSVFIGAMLGAELVGFIKFVTVGRVARIMHILSLQRHQEKRPNNALIAAAVKVCAEQSLTSLIYDKYSYNDAPSALTEFKRRNGFRAVAVPRYYIPLTTLGRLALVLGAHRGIASIMPAWLLAASRETRSACLRAPLFPRFFPRRSPDIAKTDQRATVSPPRTVSGAGTRDRP